jgi:hypothetical protein
MVSPTIASSVQRVLRTVRSFVHSARSTLVTTRSVRRTRRRLE